MNEKQAELSIMLYEIYEQTGKYYDIIVERLSEVDLDRHHADRLLFVRSMLAVKKSHAYLTGDIEKADELEKRIEFFEEIHDQQEIR